MLICPHHNLPLISSTANPQVKGWVSLKQAGQRTHLKQVLLEGFNAITEALAQGWILSPLVLNQTLPVGKVAELAAHPCVKQSIIATEACLAKMATTASPPNMVAVAPWPESHLYISEVTHLLAWLTQLNPKRLLVLAGLQDPGNVGTLLRSAAAFGVDAVLLTGDGVGWHHPKVIRASVGVLGRVPCMTLAPELTLPWLLGFLEGEAIQPLLTVGRSNEQAISYPSFSWPQAWALVLGTEGEGLNALPPATWQAYPKLTIPMVPTIDSLNVGVAGGILLSHSYPHG